MGRHRLITAPYFGAVQQKCPTTPPNSQILGTSSFRSQATKWEKANEQKVLQLHQEKQIENGYDGFPGVLLVRLTSKAKTNMKNNARRFVDAQEDGDIEIDLDCLSCLVSLGDANHFPIST